MLRGLVVVHNPKDRIGIVQDVFFPLSTNRFHGIFLGILWRLILLSHAFLFNEIWQVQLLQVLQDQGEDEVEEVDGKEDEEDVEDEEDEDAAQTAEDSKKKKRKSEAEDNKDSAAAGDWELPSIFRTLRGSDRG